MCIYVCEGRDEAEEREGGGGGGVLEFRGNSVAGFSHLQPAVTDL